jgi:hypothetical protein
MRPRLDCCPTCFSTRLTCSEMALNLMPARARKPLVRPSAAAVDSMMSSTASSATAVDGGTRAARSGKTEPLGATSRLGKKNACQP